MPTSPIQALIAPLIHTLTLYLLPELIAVANGWHYMALCPQIHHYRYVIRDITYTELALQLTQRYVSFLGDAAVGKSSLLVRLTDQRFQTNPDPTVRLVSASCPQE